VIENDGNVFDTFLCSESLAAEKRSRRHDIVLKKGEKNLFQRSFLVFPFFSTISSPPG